jgi:hypothetical protein
MNWAMIEHEPEQGPGQHGAASWPKTGLPAIAAVGQTSGRRHKKTPLPEGSGVFIFMTRKEKIPCPWQAWQ